MGKAMKTRLATLGILVLVLAAGFLLGLAWERRLIASPPEAAAPAGTEDEDGKPKERTLIIDRVGLSPEQRVLVDSIVEHHRELMTVLQADYRPRYWALIDTTREAIKSVLDPAQAAMYDSLLAANDRKRRDRDR